MVYDLNQLTQILIERLEKKGMEPSITHGLIRDLANTILVNPHMNLLQINKRLHLLGWDSFQLDYHTLEVLKTDQPAGLRTILGRISRHDRITDWIEDSPGLKRSVGFRKMSGKS